MSKPIYWALGLLAVPLFLILYGLGIIFGKEQVFNGLGELQAPDAIKAINLCLLFMLLSNIVVLINLAEWASGIAKATERDWIGTICNTEIKQHEAEKHEGNG